jgi:potassium efflux system protein
MPRASLILFCLLLSANLAAQSGAASEIAASASVAPGIEQARTALADASGLDDAAREQVEGLLARAAAADADAERRLAEARRWREAQSGLVAEAARLERELALDPSETFRRWRADLPARTAPDELARQLAELRQLAEENGLQLGATAAEIAATSSRVAVIGDELAATTHQIGTSTGTNAAPGPEASLLVIAQNLLDRATQRATLARREQLQAEQARLPALQRMLDLRHRRLQREATLLEREIDVLEAMLAARTDTELDALMRRLVQERDGLDRAEPVLAAAAERNIALGAELRDVAGQVRGSAERARQAQRSGAAALDALANTRTRIELGAGDDAVGLILLSERRRIADADALARELESARRDLARVQLRLIEIDEERDRLDAPAEAIDAQLRDSDSEDTATGSELRDTLARLFQTRSELLPRVDAALRDLADALSQLERALQEQLSRTRELTRILDRELLWIPSHEAVSADWLRRQAAGWSDLFKLSRYATSARLLLEAARERWPIALLGITLVVVLLVLRLRVPARIDELSQPLLRVRTDRYRYSARVLLLSLLAALPWPLLLAVLGWLLQHAGQAGKFSDSLGSSLIGLAGGVLLWQSLHWLTRERGLAHLHLRWTRARRGALRQVLPWMAFGLLPLSWLLQLAFIRGQEPAVDAAGRLMLLAFCAIGAWLAWRLLAPGALWTTRSGSLVEPIRIRQLLRIALPALLATLALLALNGYLLTAGLMLRSLWLSAGAVLIVGVVNAMIARWFVLGERRLALKRLEQKREAEDAGGVDRTGASGDAMPEPEPEEVTLESVNAQTRRLLRALTVALVALALLAVWSDVLPALARLDEVKLWSYSAADAAGTSVEHFVSLRAVLLGIAVLLLTFIAARNLPGLVEIGLLSRINLDAPTRYAITSISRYVIVIGGIVVGLGLFGLRWGQLQWMAAALTVGLGFGLQEIFANFVSGLIVLFERPYRVGDIITIGEVEGTVTRIRTRATTVLDWDNKEVVVPNKTFITERFVNWTLSDTVTRVVLKLGVAYTSDPEAVRRLLLDIAERDPMVLKQPPPTCWFMELGASTLNFELRVFVGELLDRNRVRNLLNQRIITEFRERGIEIAFPQMDLWVRNAPSAAAGLEAGTRAPEAPR